MGVGNAEETTWGKDLEQHAGGFGEGPNSPWHCHTYWRNLDPRSPGNAEVSDPQLA